MAVRDNPSTSAVTRTFETQAPGLSFLVVRLLVTDPIHRQRQRQRHRHPTIKHRQMATHYETLGIDTVASPEESEFSLSILGFPLGSIGSHPLFRLVSQHSRWHRTSRLTYTPLPCAL